MPLGFGFNFSADELVLQTSMMSYWGAFAWNGSPNVAGQASMWVCVVIMRADGVQTGRDILL
jgi:hypothetical protein